MRNWDNGYWDGGHMDNGWGIVMVLGMLGIWALVAVAIIWIIRSTRTHAAAPPMAPGSAAIGRSAVGGVTANAEQILAERLARGDIDPEDYKLRLEALASRGN